MLFNLFIYSHKNLPSFLKTNLCLLDIDAQKCDISGFICTSPKLTLTAWKIVNYAPSASNSQAHFSGSERLRLDIKRRSLARATKRWRHKTAHSFGGQAQADIKAIISAHLINAFLFFCIHLSGGGWQQNMLSIHLSNFHRHGFPSSILR